MVDETQKSCNCLKHSFLDNFVRVLNSTIEPAIALVNGSSTHNILVQQFSGSILINTARLASCFPRPLLIISSAYKAKSLPSNETHVEVNS